MAKKQPRKAIQRVPRTVLRLPDLDQAKSAVLNSLSSIDAQRWYRHAIEEFIEWYCSEPRLSFSKTVVLRYRIHLESRHLAPGTVNLRLGAVRRLAYEASDCGLLSPDLAAGIRRVKGVKKIGVRLGNWLTPEQSERLWNTPDYHLLKGKRDRALLAVLLACGLRRHEAVEPGFPKRRERTRAAGTSPHAPPRREPARRAKKRGRRWHTLSVPSLHRQLRRNRVGCGDRRLRRECARKAPIGERRHRGRAQGAAEEHGVTGRRRQTPEISHLALSQMLRCSPEWVLWASVPVPSQAAAEAGGVGKSRDIGVLRSRSARMFIAYPD